MLKHGTFSYDVQDSVIIFKLSGDFNEYGIQACLDAEKEVIESFGGKQCSMLIDCREATGATPEAYQAIDDFYRQIRYDNLSAIALVYANNLMARIEERGIPQMKNHRAKAFLDWQSALSWLNISDDQIQL